MKKNVLKKCIVEIIDCCKEFNCAFLFNGDVKYWDFRLDGILFVLEVSSVAIEFSRSCPNNLYTGVTVDGDYYDIPFDDLPFTDFD